MDDACCGPVTPSRAGSAAGTRTPILEYRSIPFAASGLAAVPLLPGWWAREDTLVTAAGLGCLALAAALQFAQSHALHRAAGGNGRDSRRQRGAAAAAEPRHLPSGSASSVHIACGVTPERTSRTALEVARAFLTAHERVLLVDAGRRLDLHAVLGREGPLGLGECLRGTMPLLGVVQDAGYPGLYLLARGASGTENWPALGRVIEDALRHFRRVVIAVDPACPQAAGAALAGRRPVGWWGGAGALPRAALALAERTGIAFHSIQLSPTLQETLEALLDLPLTAVPWPPPAVSAAKVATAPPMAEPAVSPEPACVECDAGVGERLRFLAWMRRLRVGDFAAAAEPRSAIASSEPIAVG